MSCEPADLELLACPRLPFVWARAFQCRGPKLRLAQGDVHHPPRGEAQTLRNRSGNCRNPDCREILGTPKVMPSAVVSMQTTARTTSETSSGNRDLKSHLTVSQRLVGGSRRPGQTWFCRFIHTAPAKAPSTCQFTFSATSRGNKKSGRHQAVFGRKYYEINRWRRVITNGSYSGRRGAGLQDMGKNILAAAQD